MTGHRIAFFLCLLGFIWIEISVGHFLGNLESHQEFRIFQAYLVLGFGAFTFSDGSMRERASLDVMFLWVTWIFLTDFIPYIPPLFASIETGALIALLSWVYFRPYQYMAAPLLYGTVYIAFYGGRNAPFLSRMAANFGFPFSSIAMIADNLAVRPSKALGCMVEIAPVLLEQKGYVFIDTGIPVTSEIMQSLESVIGSKTGYGIFRVKCLTNFMPVLEVMGKDWMPKNIPWIPSLYYRQCMESSEKAKQQARNDLANE